jgi:hypothetical protein
VRGGRRLAHSSRGKKVSPPPSFAALRPCGCVVDRLRPVDRHRDREGGGIDQPGKNDMAITDAQIKAIKQVLRVLEVVQQALDGSWTSEEMTRKIEEITGGKIERD